MTSLIVGIVCGFVLASAIDFARTSLRLKDARLAALETSIVEAIAQTTALTENVEKLRVQARDQLTTNYATDIDLTELARRAGVTRYAKGNRP